MFLLDKFPSEIFHLIFDYLWLNEILFSLFDLSFHINCSINNYKNYYLDIRYLNKYLFDWILKSFSNQIKSLIFSNDCSVGPFIQFNQLFSNLTRLESICLRNLNEQSIVDIHSNLSKLNSLKSLRLDRLPTYISWRFTRILPRLKRLDLPDANLFDQRSGELFQNLKSLTINRCSFQQFEHLFNILSKDNLREFVIKESILSQNKINKWPSFDRFPQQLTKIHLQIDIISIEFIQLKVFLSQLKHLIDINLKCIGDIDLVDGLQWEEFLLKTFSNKLKRFNFCFTICSYIDLDIEQLFQNYSRSFWLNRIEPWFICYNGRGLIFTIPFYALKMIRSDNQFIYRTTIQNTKIFFDLIKHLKIFDPNQQKQYRFDFVKCLTMEFESCHSTCEQIESIVNIQSIEHLQMFINIPFGLLNLMNNLIHLSLINLHTLYSCLNKIGWNQQFKQIRILDINYKKNDHRYEDIQPERLAQLFPNVNRLTIDGIDLRRSYLFRIIDSFDHLTYAKFQINWTRQEKFNAPFEFQRSTAKLIYDQYQTNFHLNFQTFYVHLFISNQQNFQI